MLYISLEGRADGLRRGADELGHAVLVVSGADGHARARVGAAHDVLLLGVHRACGELLVGEALDAVAADGNADLGAQAGSEHFERAELDEVRHEVPAVVRESVVVLREVLGGDEDILVVVLALFEYVADAHACRDDHAPDFRGGVETDVARDHVAHDVRAPRADCIDRVHLVVVVRNDSWGVGVTVIILGHEANFRIHS
jgi:hypothetical protein